MSTSKMKCPACGSTNIFYDSAKGEHTCYCGRVIEQNATVSELTFGESNVYGQFVSQSGDYIRIKSSLGRLGNPNISKELKRQRVYKQMQQIASQLNLTQYHVDATKRIFNMAQERNFELGRDKYFTQGRPTSHVIAAALYIICRLDKTPHLLIDFSDILQINLYVLGACYLKLVKHLRLDLPLVDPSLFIHRYCSKLEFGDKTHLVSITALRLLQRMKRDWMTYGRRPNSICGAAILIAARYHGFKRTIGQIIQTVHGCDETIRKRLEEFKKTTAAQLTRDQFENIDLENDIKEEMDPPSFKKAKESHDYQNIKNYEGELMKEDELIQEKLQSSEENTIVESREEQKQLMPVNFNDIDVISKTESCKETLSDIDDAEIDRFILTPEESSLKSILWHHIHKDWIEEQAMKKINKSETEKPARKHKKRINPIIDASDPVTALVQSNKLGERINKKVLTNLFDGDFLKKIKL